MSDIFAEVDEVMKQERLEKIWADYKGIIIAFIVGTILLTAAVSVYKSWDASAREAQTEALGAVLEATDFPQNVDLGTLNLHGDVRAMALMSAGSALLAADAPDMDRAIAYYKDVAGDKEISGSFRELASLMVARLSGEDMATAQAALETVYKNEKSLWRHHAAVELAVLAAHDKNDYVAARAYLTPVIDGKEVPAGLVVRARALDHLYSLRQNQSQK